MFVITYKRSYFWVFRKYFLKVFLRFIKKYKFLLCPNLKMMGYIGQN